MIELDDALPAAIGELRERTREFARAEIAPLVDTIDKGNLFPRALWPRLGQAGLLGLLASQEQGGLGLGYLAHCVVLEELARVSAAIAMSYAVHSSLVVDQLRRNGTARQIARYLPKLISGEWVASIAMSEADAGSDAVGMQMSADRTANGFVLCGRKRWVTNGTEADLVLVFARTTPEAGKRGLTAFLVEKSFGGMQAGPGTDVFGQRGSGVCDLRFEDCHVPADNVLGEVDRGIRVLMSGLDFERVVAASESLGVMQASIDLALPYVSKRKQFGVVVGEFQLMQGKIADMYASVSACRSYVRAAASAADRGRITRHDSAALYLFVAERTTQVALQAMQALGGNGYTNDFAASRLVRDAKVFEIGGGTVEIRRMLIGRELVNLAQHEDLGGPEE